MKNTFTWATCAIAIALASCGTPAEDNASTEASKKEKPQENDPVSLTGGRYTIDSAASTVNWKGTEITGKSHVGTVDIYKGNLEVVDETIAKAFVSMDMNTIVVTDEGMGDGAKERLLGHLKSDDFFGGEKFPVSQMFIEVIKEKDGVPHVYGKIIIRAIPQPIHFPVTLSEEDGTITVDASLAFDRSKHDVKFRSGAFPDLFPDLGDKLINYDIELDVHIVATM